LSPDVPEDTPSEGQSVPACLANSYDHDGDPNTACQPLTNCEAGQYVEDDGSSISNRACAACSLGTYSDERNATECRAWSSCGWTELETQAPSASADRSCGPGSEYRQFPTPGVATSVAVDSQGNVVVGADPAAVRKYDPNGNEIWTEQLKTPSLTEQYHNAFVAIDSQDNILVASGVDSSDATLLTKYDSDGNQVWNEAGLAYPQPPLEASFVAVDRQDNVLLVGTDAHNPYVSKFDPDGNLVWIDDFDSGPTAFARSVAVDDEGNVVVAGDVNGKLPGIGEDVPGYLFVRKYDADGTRLWTEQFGNEGGFEEAHAVAVDSKRNVLVAGFTNSEGSGGADAIVRKYDPDGNEVWTELFETGPEFPGARALAIDSEDNVLIAGNNVMVGGSASVGVFVRKYDPGGNETWTEVEAAAPDQEAVHAARAIAVDSRGRVFVVGFGYGATPGGGFVWLVPEP
jgi:hypothetical protein